MFKFATKFCIARPTQQRLDALMKQYGLTAEQVELCIQSDPTPQQTDFTPWLAKCLAKNLIRLPEDKQKLRESIETFIKARKKRNFPADKRDINRFTPETLSEFLDRYRQQPVENTNRRQQSEQIITQGASLIVSDGEYRVWKVSEPLAAMELASGTDWCTRHRENAVSYLERGPLYVCLYQNRPYAQLHIHSGQFMNRRDNTLLTKVHDRDLAWFNATYVQDRVAREFVHLMAAADPEVKEWADKFAELPDGKEGELWESKRYAALLSYALLKSIKLTEQQKDAILRSGQTNLEELVEYAEFEGKRWPQLEAHLLAGAEDPLQYSPVEAIQYAHKVIKGRWPQLEPLLFHTRRPMSGYPDTHSPLLYAAEVLTEPWPEMEQLEERYYSLRYYEKYAVEYCINAKKARWPAFEKAMLEHLRKYLHDNEVDYTSEAAELTRYTARVVKGRWPEWEKLIMEFGYPSWILNYATLVIKGRWPEAEPLLFRYLRNDDSLYAYWKRFIKGRWSALEDFLLYKTKHFSSFPGILSEYLRWLRSVGEDWSDGELASQLSTGYWNKQVEQMLQRVYGQTEHERLTPGELDF